ncbi:MAG TPA: tetratricopeptide repeat protein [Paraburkholderia sp.]|uniref:tetratricopeptide repeat protein n=1 Tax=Paraburkholderia sp. TaxID=1926495 RepID=UPI002B48A87C|nr:tetratricopeptide repeat protein [Paraburkholderia sp.]HKR44347.1 tetratricopeptide repeat protein [Paraburkholderia sp.]
MSKASTADLSTFSVHKPVQNRESEKCSAEKVELGISLNALRLICVKASSPGSTASASSPATTLHQRNRKGPFAALLAIALFIVTGPDPVRAAEPAGILSCNALTCAEALLAYCTARVDREGLLFKDVEELTEDNRRTLRACRKAAELGLASAEELVGVQYLGALSLGDKRFEAAVPWLSAAAENGNSAAQYELGMLYRDGHGVPRDSVLAYKWIMLSSVTRPGTQSALDAIAGGMSHDELQTAASLIRNWRPRSLPVPDAASRPG